VSERNPNRFDGLVVRGIVIGAAVLEVGAVIAMLVLDDG
jgi:hypothetical protein